MHFSVLGIRSETLLHFLAERQIYVSSGSACASRKQKLSGVLTAMGLSTERIDSALRFSLCPGLTAEEMTYTADRLAAQYQVAASPTILFFKDGQEQNRIRGLAKRPALEEVIQTLI